MSFSVLQGCSPRSFKRKQSEFIVKRLLHCSNVEMGFLQTLRKDWIAPACALHFDGTGQTRVCDLFTKLLSKHKYHKRGMKSIAAKTHFVSRVQSLCYGSGEQEHRDWAESQGALQFVDRLEDGVQ